MSVPGHPLCPRASSVGAEGTGSVALPPPTPELGIGVPVLSSTPTQCPVPLWVPVLLGVEVSVPLELRRLSIRG